VHGAQARVVQQEEFVEKCKNFVNTIAIREEEEAEEERRE
jgi:hypothetical protein